MQKKFFLLLMSMFFITPLAFAVEDTTPTLDYIKSSSEDGTYTLYGKNILSDSWLTNVYIDDKKINGANITFSKENISVRNIYRNAGSFMVERMKVLYESGATITKYITDKKTDIIKIRKNNIIGFSDQVIRDNRNNVSFITLPFINKTTSDILLGQESIKSERKIIINGQEKPLVEYSGEYKDNVYYFTDQWIIFIEKNLTERINTIGLKIDGLSSNYISVIKKWISLENPSRIEVEDTGISKNLRIFFPEPRNFNSLTNKEIFINGAKIDMNQATIGLGQLIIRYDISKLPKDQDTLSIILKDTLTLEYSNELLIHIGTYSLPIITSIDTGKWASASFTFVIKGSTMTFFGDMYKLKININGIDYTREGTKEPIKDIKGVVQKDSNGVDRYEIKNKIEITRMGDGLQFDFPSNLLRDGENIVFIKNDNTWRESNKVSFIKGDSKSINYNYLTGSILIENSSKEWITFEIGKDFEKKVNPTVMTATERNISIWKLKLSNLRSNEYYSLAFVLNANLSINPFSSLALDATSLETVKENNKLSFHFQKQGYGKDFKTDMDLLALINELYNASDKSFLLNISEINLKKITKDNTDETVVSLKNPLQANIFYAYANNTCFDGVKDFCSLISEIDPLLSINYSASWTPIIVSTPPLSAIKSSTGSTAKVTRKNITVIVPQEFENAKFKKVQDILVKKYDDIKKKGSIYVPTFRKAVNNLLLWLKNFELKTNITESISQIKNSLKTINEVLRQVAKE